MVTQLPNHDSLYPRIIEHISGFCTGYAEFMGAITPMADAIRRLEWESKTAAAIET